MNHNHFEAIQVVQKLAYRLEADDYDRCDVVVCPTFICLRSVQTVIESDRMTIGLGAQNCYFEEKGAFTGEVSAPMLAKMNVQYVISKDLQYMTIDLHYIFIQYIFSEL